MARDRRREGTRVAQIDSLERAAARVEHLETVDCLARDDASDAPGSKERVPRQGEGPLGVAELGLLMRQCRYPAVALDVEVRPTCAIRDEVQLAFRAPDRLED